MKISSYQRAASRTIQFDHDGPQGAIPPLLGLAHETGSILNVYKKYQRDSLDPANSRQFLKEELGDLLWYLAAASTAIGLDLEEIAETNLRRTRDRYLPKGSAPNFSKLPVLDKGYPPRERFPRRLTISFGQRRSSSGHLTASLKLVSAQPNSFANGPVKFKGKEVGFLVGARLGAQLTDNSRRVDDYRFHDAIHMGFMAVLGWSPTMRALLRLKRKSKRLIDDVEDGARAIYAEEGLAAVLARLAEQRNQFHTEESIDGDALVVVKAATLGLEAERLPGWLWRRAINQGFKAMHLLGDNGGGYLVADLDKRELIYRKI